MKKPVKPLRMPPKVGSEHDKALDAFAAGADYPAGATGGSTPSRLAASHGLPWEAAGVRADVIKNFALRIPEPMYLKLKFIAENTPYSMNSFVSEHIAPAIEAELSRLAGK